MAQAEYLLFCNSEVPNAVPKLKTDNIRHTINMQF